MNIRHFKIKGFEDARVRIESESPQALRNAILHLESKGMVLESPDDMSACQNCDELYVDGTGNYQHGYGFCSVGCADHWAMENLEPNAEAQTLP